MSHRNNTWDHSTFCFLYFFNPVANNLMFIWDTAEIGIASNIKGILCQFDCRLEIEYFWMYLGPCPSHLVLPAMPQSLLLVGYFESKSSFSLKWKGRDNFFLVSFKRPVFLFLVIMCLLKSCCFAWKIETKINCSALRRRYLDPRVTAERPDGWALRARECKQPSHVGHRVLDRCVGCVWKGSEGRWLDFGSSE